MTPTLRRIAATLVVASLTVVLPANAATETIRKSYLPANDGYGFCEIEPVAPGVVDQTWGQNIGAVCIALKGKHKQVRIQSIIDSASAAIDFSWYFLDKDWAEVGKPSLTEDPEGYLLESGDHHAFGCDYATDNKAATPWIDKPKGARYFYVFVHGALLGGAFNAAGLGECGGETAMATVGEVTLKLRS